MSGTTGANIDRETVAGFGDEWATYDQTEISDELLRRIFDAYFSVFPFDALPANAEGFDLGCGSGRWASLMIERVRVLHCIDPSPDALNVARRRLADAPGARFHLAGADEIPLADGSQDFGYSLGVLHHIPDTRKAMADCVRKLKSGAPFLVYLYYRFDNRPAWFKAVWRLSDIGRSGISRLPFGARRIVTEAIAAGVYWPLARLSGLLERAGMNVSNFPLGAYRDKSYYVMRTDALDRFGTRLEHRFTRREIEEMMLGCGLTDIRFHEEAPFWTACGRKA